MTLAQAAAIAEEFVRPGVVTYKSPTFEQRVAIRKLVRAVAETRHTFTVIGAQMSDFETRLENA